MKLLLLIIGLLPLFVTCCTSRTCCQTKTLNLRLDSDASGKKYSRNCNETPNIEYLAVCIAQRTSLQTILACANAKKGWEVKVPPHSLLDNAPLPAFLSSSRNGELANEQYNVKNDGLVMISARGVLQNVAYFCRYHTTWDLQPIFDACPFRNTQEFLSCLCVHRVQDPHILELHACLVKVGSLFAEPRELPKGLAPWMCQGTLTEFVHPDVSVPASS